MTPPIVRLPTESVENIASFLPRKDILNFRLASSELAVKSCDAFKAEFEQVINSKARRRIGSKEVDEAVFVEICKYSSLASCLHILYLGLEAVKFDISGPVLGLALSQLLNLTELELYLPPRPASMVMFHGLCSSTQIPSFARIKLTGHGFANHEDFMMLFKNHLSTLEKVDFHDVRLPENIWPVVLDSLAGLTRLCINVQNCTRGSLLDDHYPAFYPLENEADMGHWRYWAYREHAYGYDKTLTFYVEASTFEKGLACLKQCYVGNRDQLQLEKGERALAY
jgi:hypothetical protein